MLTGSSCKQVCFVSLQALLCQAAISSEAHMSTHSSSLSLPWQQEIEAWHQQLLRKSVGRCSGQRQGSQSLTPSRPSLILLFCALSLPRALLRPTGDSTGPAQPLPKEPALKGPTVSSLSPERCASLDSARTWPWGIFWMLSS